MLLLTYNKTPPFLEVHLSLRNTLKFSINNCPSEIKGLTQVSATAINGTFIPLPTQLRTSSHNSCNLWKKLLLLKAGLIP